jgi:hypothetical protein
MTQSTFDKFYLKRGQPMSGGGLQLKDPRPDLPWRLAMLKSQLKRRLS